MQKAGKFPSASLEAADLSQEYRTFEEEISRREEARQLHCALDRLPEDYRTVLHLLYFEGLSYEEAARVMKKTASRSITWPTGPSSL